MQKFEYRVLNTASTMGLTSATYLEQALNELAEQGWKLHTCAGSSFIFEREVAAPALRQELRRSFEFKPASIQIRKEPHPTRNGFEITTVYRGDEVMFQWDESGTMTRSTSSLSADEAESIRCMLKAMGCILIAGSFERNVVTPLMKAGAAR